MGVLPSSSDTRYHACCFTPHSSANSLIPHPSGRSSGIPSGNMTSGHSPDLKLPLLLGASGRCSVCSRPLQLGASSWRHGNRRRRRHRHHHHHRRRRRRQHHHRHRHRHRYHHRRRHHHRCRRRHIHHQSCRAAGLGTGDCRAAGLGTAGLQGLGTAGLSSRPSASRDSWTAAATIAGSDAWKFWSSWTSAGINTGAFGFSSAGRTAGRSPCGAWGGEAQLNNHISGLSW